MRTSPHLAFCAMALVVTGLMSRIHAESEKMEPPPYAFSTHSYPFSAVDLEIAFLSKDKSELKAPALPPPSAGQGEQEAFLKRSHEVVKEYLATQEVPLPPGSLACYDAASETLSLRTTNAVHDMMRALSNAYVQEVPKHLSWRLEIVEAPSADVRSALQQCRGRTEHGKQLDELTAKGVIITTMRGECNGGQQTTARQGSGFNRPVSYFTDASGQVQPETEYAYSGVRLELDPVIGEGGSISINCSFQYWPTAPKARLAQLTAGSAPKVEAEWLDLPAFTTEFGSTYQSGETRLLGVWDLDTLGDPAKAGRSQAAFFCTHAVSLLPLAEPRLEALLRDRGEAVIPTPKVVPPVADPTKQPSMIVRRYRVPPDFESMSSGPDSSSPVDPFAAGASTEKQPRKVRHTKAEEILKGMGIPFPPGSSAEFLPGSSELVVRNLPENIDLVDAFVGVGCFIGGRTKMAQITVEIIEADAALLRRLAREVEALPDHSAALKTLEAEIAAGKAKVFRTAWIETKAGQQATWENIIQTKTTAEFGIGSATPPAAPKKEGDAEPDPAISSARRSEIYVHSEEEKIGFMVELDPVINEGGIIDLNLILRADTAPLSALPAAATPEPGTQRLATVNAVRRHMEVKTSITLRKGVPRFLTLYQPTTAEGPAPNILHAVFVRSDIAYPGLEEK